MAYKGSEFLKEYKREYQNFSTIAVVLVCILTAVSCVSCKHQWKMATYYGVITDAATGKPIKDGRIRGTYATEKEFRPFDPGYVVFRYDCEDVIARTSDKGTFRINLGTWRPRLRISHEEYRTKHIDLSDHPLEEKLHIELQPKTETQKMDSETAGK